MLDSMRRTLWRTRLKLIFRKQSALCMFLEGIKNVDEFGGSVKLEITERTALCVF
jgi:hypothetical protein